MPNFLGITDDIRQQMRQPTDIEHMRDRYRCVDNIFVFPSPTLETIEKNLFYLLKYSEYTQLHQKYHMRPDYLSFDTYGTVILDQLLMFVNGIFNVEQFSVDKIVIPSFASITYICQDKFSVDRDIDDLTEVGW